jgi:hypothetical protein
MRTCSCVPAGVYFGGGGGVRACKRAHTHVPWKIMEDLPVFDDSCGRYNDV